MDLIFAIIIFSYLLNRFISEKKIKNKRDSEYETRKIWKNEFIENYVDYSKENEIEAELNAACAGDDRKIRNELYWISVSIPEISYVESEWKSNKHFVKNILCINRGVIPRELSYGNIYVPTLLMNKKPIADFEMYEKHLIEWTNNRLKKYNTGAELRKLGGFYNFYKASS